LCAGARKWLEREGHGLGPSAPQKIDKLSLGQLAEAFVQIQNQNYTDVTIGKGPDAAGSRWRRPP
jgi:hypothetical protein